MDPLHGVVSSTQAASSFTGSTRLRRELEFLSCDPEKANKIEQRPQGEEVDQLCSLLSAPSCAWASHSGGDSDLRAPGLSFSQWSAQLHERLVLEEAEKKKQALADLAHQVRRRARAQVEYQTWLDTKSDDLSFARRSAHRTAASEKLSPEEEQEAKQEKERTWREWCERKDSERVFQSALSRSLSRSARARSDEERAQRHRLGQQAFEEWKKERDEAEVETRRQRQLSSRAVSAAALRDAAEKQARFTSEYAAFLDRSAAQRKQVNEEKRKQENEEKERKKERLTRVQQTRREQEVRLSRDLARFQQEQRQKALEDELQRKREHRTNWRKKEQVVAYSTMERTKLAFR
jgi:DNA repair exonuclease SbcCD ATPase subunit